VLSWLELVARSSASKAEILLRRHGRSHQGDGIDLRAAINPRWVYLRILGECRTRDLRFARAATPTVMV